MDDKKKQNRPVEVLRAGDVRVAVWENTNEKGQAYFTLSPERMYTNKRGEYCSSVSFSLSQAELVARLLELAAFKAKTRKARATDAEQINGSATE